MHDVWLHKNRRLFALGAIPLAGLLLSGLGLLGMADPSSRWHAAGWGMVGLSLVAGAWLLVQATQPRLGYAGWHLCVYLRFGRPYRVPIELVECFFIGQADAALPMAQQRDPRVTSIVVRLAESATDWKNRDVRPSLGQWEDGYITLRGTWSAPITLDSVTELNHRLRDAHGEIADVANDGNQNE